MNSDYVEKKLDLLAKKRERLAALRQHPIEKAWANGVPNFRKEAYVDPAPVLSIWAQETETLCSSWLTTPEFFSPLWEPDWS